MGCRCSSTTVRSAAMPAAVATASTNLLNVWPTGSSAYRPTPVETLAAYLSATCRANLPGVGPDAAAALSLRTQNQRPNAACQGFYTLQRPLQLPISPPSPANSRQISARPVINPRVYGIAVVARAGLAFTILVRYNSSLVPMSTASTGRTIF